MRLQDNAPRAIIAVSLGIVLLIAAIAAIVLLQRPALRDLSAGKDAVGPPAKDTSTPSRGNDLAPERAALLIQEALANYIVVVRITLGDIVTVDADDHERSQDYVALANAGVIEFKYCNFPGRARGPRQVCIAELTDAARLYAQEVDSAKKPLRSITPADGEPAPLNRHLVDLIVAQPRLQRIDPFVRSSGEIQRVTYTSAYALTPIAKEFGVMAETLPALPSRASFERSASGWRLAPDHAS
jgi:hypothetical protein